MPQPTPGAKLPLLEALVARWGLSALPIYTNRDVAELFKTSVRTIQDWITDGKMTPRNLPGRGRFLPEDLEAFLENSSNNQPIGGAK